MGAAVGAAAVGMRPCEGLERSSLDIKICLKRLSLNEGDGANNHDQRRDAR